MLTSDQLRTENFRITQIHAPGSFPLDKLPTEWQWKLGGMFAFEFEGPGWPKSICYAESTDQAGANHLLLLQSLYDGGGAQAVRRWVEDEQEADKKARGYDDDYFRNW